MEIKKPKTFIEKLGLIDQDVVEIQNLIIEAKQVFDDKNSDELDCYLACGNFVVVDDILVEICENLFEINRDDACSSKEFQKIVNNIAIANDKFLELKKRVKIRLAEDEFYDLEDTRNRFRIIMNFIDNNLSTTKEKGE